MLKGKRRKETQTCCQARGQRKRRRWAGRRRLAGRRRRAGAGTPCPWRGVLELLSLHTFSSLHTGGGEAWPGEGPAQGHLPGWLRSWQREEGPGPRSPQGHALNDPTSSHWAPPPKVPPPASGSSSLRPRLVTRPLGTAEIQAEQRIPGSHLHYDECPLLPRRGGLGTAPGHTKSTGLW